MQKASSIVDMKVSPFIQAAVAIGLSLILMLLAYFVKGAGMDFSPRFPWMIAGACIMMFSLFNSLFSLGAEDPTKNWGRSILSFLILVVSVSLLAWGFSGISLNDAGSFSWIFLVLTIGYLIFLSMVNIIKRIVEFAMKEDWQHPRIRNRKRKK